MRTRHIGVVGVSAEGAALCYRTICAEGAELCGQHNHPEITLHTYPLASYMEHIERGGWEGVAARMLSSARKLQEAGADFLICPDNTVHQAMPFIERESPLPWLHIAEVVATEACARGFRRVALLGTRWLVLSDVYPSKLTAEGIDYRRPSDEDREHLNEIITRELVYGRFLPASVTAFQRVIERMGAQGCDAVVLGCTEIPLIINDANSPLPVLDSTRLLARAALRTAMKPGA